MIPYEQLIMDLLPGETPKEKHEKLVEMLEIINRMIKSADKLWGNEK